MQAATGISDIDELVENFIAAEDQNFSLFTCPARSRLPNSGGTSLRNTKESGILQHCRERLGRVGSVRAVCEAQNLLDNALTRSCKLAPESALAALEAAQRSSAGQQRGPRGTPTS